MAHSYAHQYAPAAPMSSLVSPITPSQSTQGSIAMEQSPSSSSISSSVASFSSSISLTSRPLATTHQEPSTPRPSAYAHSGKSVSPGKNITPAPTGCIDMEENTKLPCDIRNPASLLSPPGAEPADSFSASSDHSRRPGIDGAGMVATTSIFPSSQPPTKLHDGQLSPPVSPRPITQTDTTLRTAHGTKDPILYPASNDMSSSALHERALFPSTVPALISNHVATRSPLMFTHVPRPRDDDYKLALNFRSTVLQRFNENPRAWLEAARTQLLIDRRLSFERKMRLERAPPTPKPAQLPTVARQARNWSSRVVSKVLSTPQVSAAAGQTREGHTRLPALHPVHDSATRVAKRPNRVSTGSRQGVHARIAPQVGVISGQVVAGLHRTIHVAQGSPEPRIRTTAPNREDKDFVRLDDYCPPLSTLPERTNNLKVDWKGTALDLSKDIHRHLLHRDEVGLAASLRLDCATYLTSKRRIFIRRLECAKIGKEFRKTDAQQACKIDVNKASKLWTAYEKVGWLHPEHMRPFLRK